MTGVFAVGSVWRDRLGHGLFIVSGPPREDGLYPVRRENDNGSGGEDLFASRDFLGEYEFWYVLDGYPTTQAIAETS
jgi:hypothetical protein